MNIYNNQFLPTTETLLYQYMALAYMIQYLITKKFVSRIVQKDHQKIFIPPNYIIGDAIRDRFSQTKYILGNKIKTLILEYMQKQDGNDFKHDVDRNLRTIIILIYSYSCAWNDTITTKRFIFQNVKHKYFRILGYSR